MAGGPLGDEDDNRQTYTSSASRVDYWFLNWILSKRATSLGG